MDLPGYGYARASHEDRGRWGETVEEYLLGRENLRGLVLVFDVRRDPDEDEALVEDLARGRRLSVVRVATKIDKLGRAERLRRLRNLERASGTPWLPFSSRTREGRDALTEALAAAAEG